MHGESSSNIYQEKFQRSTTSLVRTGKSQTFKPAFLENVILQLLLFKNLLGSRNAFDVTMRYLIRTNTSYEHPAKKFERTVLTCVGRGGSEMAACLQRFFVR